VTTREPRPPRQAEAGFTLLEVLVTLAILGYAVVSFQTIVGTSVDRALVTKVNRQLRQLVEYQMGQVAVGKLHPEEEDPFPDGQSGSFEDVGGYPEEYESFTWHLKREEVPICGTDEEELREAGFQQLPGGTGGFIRPQTDDILSGADEHLEKPKGQFKSRVTLTVRWSGLSADEDREFSIVTYLPVNGEEEEGAGAGSEMPGAGTNTPGGAQGGAGLERAGGAAKENK
jgi:prepilin-type N-terminal cleavage/methylation domain-containing protein